MFDPFFLNNIDNYTDGRKILGDSDYKNIKSTLYRVSNNNGCDMGVCCDINDSYENVDKNYLNNFKKLYPKIKLLKKHGEIDKILLSSIDKDEADWIEPGPYHICKISKSKY